MTMKRLKLPIILATLIFSIGCDQVTKIAARDHLQGQQMQSYIGDTFRLTYAENSGAFLSLGSTLPDTWRTIIFVVLVAIFLGGFFIWMLRSKHLTWTALMASTLIVGGGIGNLIDRVVFDGKVTDFMNMGIGDLRTGIFNVADIWIVVGAVMMIIVSFQKPPEEEETPQTQEELS